MEKSKSGATIYRHNDKCISDYKIPSGSSSVEEISDHIEKYIGNIELVFHELVSDTVHIDIHWVKPTKEKPYHTLITSGMSDLPMQVPEGSEEDSYLELSICLPEEWKISDEDFKDEENYWPIRWLKILALFPHKHNTWFGFGHTIPNGDPAMPFTESTNLTTWLFLPGVNTDKKFHQLKLKNKTINFLSLIPLCNDEVDLKMNMGVEALFDNFDKHGINDILDIKRDSVMKRKKIFGIF